MKIYERILEVQNGFSESRSTTDYIFTITEMITVEQYKYLGVTLDELGITEIELNNRIGKANNTFHSLNK